MPGLEEVNLRRGKEGTVFSVGGAFMMAPRGPLGRKKDITKRGVSRDL